MIHSNVGSKEHPSNYQTTFSEGVHTSKHFFSVNSTSLKNISHFDTDIFFIAIQLVIKC